VLYDTFAVFVWSPQGASCVQVPLAGFSVNSLKWNADGSSLLLMVRRGPLTARTSKTEYFRPPPTLALAALTSRNVFCHPGFRTHPYIPSCSDPYNLAHVSVSPGTHYFGSASTVLFLFRTVMYTVSPSCHLSTKSDHFGIGRAKSELFEIGHWTTSKPNFPIDAAKWVYGAALQRL